MAKTHIIAVAGKGGVGKTTTCGMIIDYLCKQKKGPILVVDADANSNLNEVLGVEVETTLGDIREEMAHAEQTGTVPANMTKADYAEMKFNSALIEEDDYDMLVMGRTQGKDVNPIHKSAIESQIFYPITFPISIGPGSVSVILTLMASVSMKNGWARGLLSYAIIALVIVLMCLILYLFLSQGERIIRKIGNSGSIVINKMVAFFTFCVGVQIVVTGIAKLFNLHV